MSETRDRIAALTESGLRPFEIAAQLGISRATVSYHRRRLGLADGRFGRRYPWADIQTYYDEGHSVRECIAKFGFSSASWHEARLRGEIVARPPAMPLEELLAAPRNRSHLKRRLLAAGLKASRRECCGIENWRGEPLSMELHHLNGDGQDNRLENLAILCPNCHSQTDNFAGRNRGRLTVVEEVRSAPPAERCGAEAADAA